MTLMSVVSSIHLTTFLPIEKKLTHYAVIISYLAIMKKKKVICQSEVHFKATLQLKFVSTESLAKLHL